MMRQSSSNPQPSQYILLEARGNGEPNLSLGLAKTHNRQARLSEAILCYTEVSEIYGEIGDPKRAAEL